MKLFRNISYTLLSNLLSILVSALIVLIVPKFIGVNSYGMWQIFYFYAGYVGVLHLGWADGLFLRRGGQYIEKIDSKEIKSETILFLLFNLIIGSTIFAVGIFVQPEYRFIICALGFTVVIVNFRTWITMILQSTEQFKKFAINLSTQSLIYIILVLLFLLFGVRKYEFMIMAFLISQIFTSISGLVQIHQFILEPGWDFPQAVIESKKNINAGSKLMVANFTAMLIIGVVRFGIQQKWSVATFGKVSLILTIANLLMVFINAVSLVLFPSLRRTTQNTLRLYNGIRDVLMPLLFLMMIFYFPMKIIIPIWLPKYAGVVKYFSVLVPMMIYQGKFEILSNTFMKNLRMEKSLLLVNLSTLLLSISITYYTIWIKHNLTHTIISIAVVMAFRSVLSEFILRNHLDIPFGSEIFIETIIVFGFMWLTWNCSLRISLGVYIVSMLGYLVIRRHSIADGFLYIKDLSKY